MLPSRTIVFPGRCAACAAGAIKIPRATMPTTAAVIQRHISFLHQLHSILTRAERRGYVRLMTVAGMPPSHPCMVGYTAVWYPARRNHDLNRRIMGSPEVSEV